MAGLFDDKPVEVTGYARVALERGIDLSAGGLTYGVPPGIENLKVGERVVVPLGRGDRPVAGYVTGVLSKAEAEGGGGGLGFEGRGVKLILSRDPRSISLTDDLMELARWVAGYYCCPLGMVLAAMLPAAVKQGRGTVKKQLVSLVERGAEMGEAGQEEPKVKVSKLQRAVLACAARLAGQGRVWVEVRELAGLAGAGGVSPVKALVGKGLLELKEETEVRARDRTVDLSGSGDFTDCVAEHDPISCLQDSRDARSLTVAARSGSVMDNAANDKADGGLELNEDQRRVVGRLIEKLGEFGVHLLHGVTGSGKTEVYLRLIEHVLGRGGVEGNGSTHLGNCEKTRSLTVAARSGAKQVTGSPCGPEGSDSGVGAIVLVPEIALTGQTVRRFVERFGEVAVLHSGLTGAQRHEQWRRIREGRVRIVVGARSAVFAPLPRVGVIVVDEEHDNGYKQDQLPRYHGRDVAIKRGQILGVPVVLGSATPSLESYYNATVKGTYQLLELPRRVAGLRLPEVEIVDMRGQPRERRGVELLSVELERALGATLSNGGQAMLLINRRGWAHYIACSDAGCGWLMNCDHCDAMMVYHKEAGLVTGGVLKCHHCRAEQIVRRACPVCGKKVVVFGQGTQRVEEQVERKFPGVRMLRMDSDTMQTARDYREGLDAFGRGEVDLLVGTQMIAKGLDFPNVRLVGVVSADTALAMPDFRAAERTFQLIAQVAGRAGRGEGVGRVIVQTLRPDDEAIVLAAGHDYKRFAGREIGLRREVGLPPASRMARVVVRDREAGRCEKDAGELAGRLRGLNEQLDLEVEIHGPGPCAIGRIAGYYRQQIELVGHEPGGAGRLQRLLTGARNARWMVSDGHTAVDVDPVVVM